MDPPPVLTFRSSFLMDWTLLSMLSSHTLRSLISSWIWLYDAPIDTIVVFLVSAFVFTWFHFDCKDRTKYKWNTHFYVSENINMAISKAAFSHLLALSVSACVDSNSIHLHSLNNYNCQYLFSSLHVPHQIEPPQMFSLLNPFHELHRNE